MKFVLFLTFSLGVAANICSTPKSTFRFSGFKFTRTYHISPMSLTSQAFLVITHCTKGVEDYENILPMDSNPEALFNKTICLSHSNPQSQVSLKGVAKTENIWTLVETMLDQKLLKLTKKARIQYKGTSENRNIQASYHPTPDFSCFKLARRRHYALLNLQYYIPYTFVGGIFGCKLSIEDKAQAFKNLNQEVACDTSVPLHPLIADDPSRYWISLQTFPLEIIHLIPYLKTTSSWDIRFGETWAANLNGSEDYSFDQLEIQKITSALSKRANHLHELASPPSFNLGQYWNLKNLSSFSLKFSKYLQSLLQVQSLWDNIVT